MQQNFIWKGINADGLRIKGKHSAINLEICKKELLTQNILPIKIYKKIQIPFFRKNTKIKPKHITEFSKQLATLLNANIPLATALEILSHDSNPPHLKTLVLEIKSDIEQGNSLTSSFKKHPSHFDAFFCTLINIGEKSGALDLMLQQISTHKEKAEKQKNKIIKALLYPIVVLIITIIVTAILLIFVIPQFKVMFEGFGAALPLYTQFIIKLSELAQNQGWIIISIFIVFIISYKWSKKYSPTFKRKHDELILKLPIISNILKKIIICRFTKILAIMLKSGLPILDALAIAANTTNNWFYEQAILKICHQISNGQYLHKAMLMQNLFPMRMIQTISLAEESGTLDIMLAKIALSYEEEIDLLADNLNNLLEPIIMIVLGTLVGGLIIGMYLPIFRLGTVI